jgi:hypothetical protein
MSNRVTMADIYATLERFQASVGDGWTYGIGGAYGGHKIVRYDPSGGQWDVSTGYRSKRETLEFLNAMLAGISEYRRQPPSPPRLCAVENCGHVADGDGPYPGHCGAHAALAGL